MSERKFKFVSPGIFINEIDNSQLPSLPLRVGPSVIGRTERGPGMRPIRVQSMSDFINIFGNPIPGGRGGDVWRYGNYTAPTYAAYAAQAYLKNNGPVVVVRLMGEKHPDADSTLGTPGWTTNNDAADASRVDNGGAFGLFIFPSSSANTTAGAYSLANGIAAESPATDLMRINVHPCSSQSLAVTFAVWVLPVPYGPSSKTPRFKGMPAALTASVYRIGVNKLASIEAARDREKISSLSRVSEVFKNSGGSETSIVAAPAVDFAGITSS